VRAEKKNERSMNRQERRRQERLEKKQGGKEYEMRYDLIQPWSVPVMKTTLPPNVLQTMIEISDLVIADKDATSYGEHLAGQIEKELLVEHNILEQTGVMDFFLGAIRQFVIVCLRQKMPQPHFVKAIQREEWLIQMLIMWIISQQPNEYNPIHIHTQCQISSVMYLKVPKMLPSKKEHRPNDDGSILFTNSASRDLDLSVPDIVISPKAGDFFIFGAQQQHAVYPYRCAEGQEDTERRSISCNVAFQSEDGSGLIGNKK
jgi:hypothetical protein